jgi:ribose 5-phosphate isomerase A
MSVESQKKAAAEEALKFIKSGQRVGLGTGTTANYFIAALAAKVKKEKWDIHCVATSNATEELGRKLGLQMSTIEELPFLDLTVDGADEFDANFRLIKGAGGALHREKIVAASSKWMVVIADQSKQVKTLGKFPLPVEVSKMGVKATAWKIERAFKHLNLQGKMILRLQAGAPFVTEGGNYIIDCHLGSIPDPEKLDGFLNNTPGVIESGIFVGICGIVLMGTEKGVTEFVKK